MSPTDGNVTGSDSTDSDAGRALAERHGEIHDEIHGETRGEGQAVEPFDPALSLLNYAEIPYHGEWTLRSALVRLAQPDPVRVGALLTLARRLDAPLHHVKRTLERQIVVCERDGERYADVRTADLGRLVADGRDPEQLLAGYQQSLPPDQQLTNEESLAVPLLAVAANLERLASVLAAWAFAGPQSPPVDEVDRVVDYMSSELDRLAVPEETGFRR